MSRFSRLRTLVIWSLGVAMSLAAALALAVPDLDGPPPASSAGPGAETVATARLSAVLVTASGCAVSSVGTGVVVAEGIITNAHVVAGSREVLIVTTSGDRLNGEVRAFDPERDLALLHVPDLDVPVLIPGRPRGGTEAVALVRDDDRVDVVPVSIERTINIFITDIYGEGRHQRAGLELDGVISPGDSGGGIVDAEGELVGVVFSASLGSPEVAYAISAVELDRFVSSKADAPVDTGACL